MSSRPRVDDSLFEKDHYMGRPADPFDKIISRRIELVHKIPNFIDPDKTLLEIGCGNGSTILQLSNYFSNSLGVELFQEHENDFIQLQKDIKSTNCSFKLHNIEKEPTPAQFDRLISFEVIEHLKDENGVANYYKSLKKGGLVAISVPNKWWIFETHGAKLPLLPWNRVPFFSWLPRSIHERWSNARIYTKSRINNLLVKHGFEIISMDYITAPMDVLPKGKFKNFIVNCFFKNNTTKIPFKSTSIFVVAIKK